MKGSLQKRRVVAVVPAAGLGKRFGPGKDKPFQTLGGKPLVIRPLDALQSIPEIVEIIPVLKTEDMDRGRSIFEEYNISKIKKIAAGGKERQDSVYNGIKLIEDKNCLVLIHDGVRPLIERAQIEDAVKELIVSSSAGEVDKVDGVVLGVPVKDTIKQVAGEIVKKTLSRSSLWAVQTPQVFLYDKILAAYDQAIKEGFYSTDDSALVEHHGGKVKMIMGSYRNIKVTTPEDILIAETLLRINPNF